MHNCSCIVLLLLLVSCSPKSDTHSMGIGRFNINQTTIKIIDSLKEELHSPVLKYTDLESMAPFYEGKMKGFRIAEISSDTAASLMQSTLKYLRKFYVIDYTTGGLHFQHLVLDFYKDTLIEIFSEGNQELQVVMEQKYGNGEFERKITHQHCKCSSTGTDSSYAGVNTFQVWIDSPFRAQIKARDLLDYYCKPERDTLFKIFDAVKFAAISKIEKDVPAKPDTN